MDFKKLTEQLEKCTEVNLKESVTDKYYVCTTPFRVGMGAWSWRVKPNDIFKIDASGKWWVYNLETDKFIPKYAFNGADTQFNLEGYGNNWDRKNWMNSFEANCDTYNEKTIKPIIEKVKQSMEFRGKKKDILKYLDSMDDKSMFLIKKI